MKKNPFLCMSEDFFSNAYFTWEWGSIPLHNPVHHKAQPVNTSSFQTSRPNFYPTIQRKSEQVIK